MSPADGTTLLADACGPVSFSTLEAELNACKTAASRDAVCTTIPLLRSWRNKPLSSAFRAAQHNAYVIMARVLLGQSEDADSDRALAGKLWGMGEAA
jgi:hypothetical protein